MNNFSKTAGEVLDYIFDFAENTNQSKGTDYLESGETIASIVSVTAETGLTVDSSTLANSSTSVLVWLSGGTVGRTYFVTCKITTTSSRTVERSINVKIVSRKEV